MNDPQISDRHPSREPTSIEIDDRRRLGRVAYDNAYLVGMLRDPAGHVPTEQMLVDARPTGMEHGRDFPMLTACAAVFWAIVAWACS